MTLHQTDTRDDLLAPTDLAPADLAAALPIPTHGFDIEAYTPVPVTQRHDGWTAERQRVFLVTPAQTGRVNVAARAAGVCVRSAYTLRHHPLSAAFAAGWDQALLLATDLLTAIAFERAIAGTPRELRRDGRVIAAVTQPSDKLLMFLLGRFVPHRFGPAAPNVRFADGRVAAARAALPTTMAALAAVPNGPA